MSQKLKELWKWAPMALFHEKPNFHSFFECHFHIGFHSLIQIRSCWFLTASATSLTLPCVSSGFLLLLSMLKSPTTKRAAIRNHHHHHHHQTTNCHDKQLFAGEQEGQGWWGRSSGHDDDNKDGETVTTRRRRRRRRRRQWCRCIQDDGMIMFCIGGGIFFIFNIPLALPSCICMGLVLLCIVPPRIHKILNINAKT